MYPNPVQTGKQFYLDNVPDGSKVSITNPTGKVVLVNNNWEDGKAIQTSQLTPGVYFIQVKRDQTGKVLKLIVL